MPRYTGMCSHCGDENHPKGNVFTVVQTLLWECEAQPAWRVERDGWVVPATRYSKICNNCGQAHPFHTRMSAQMKAREAKLQATIAWLDAQEA